MSARDPYRYYASTNALAELGAEIGRPVWWMQNHAKRLGLTS